ncbi:nusB family protein [Bacteroides sp. CAG:927]|jgi:transcription antitermination protein NusB|nr:nusB family protein [Bacteroides sp. CAG:927]
MLYAYLLTQSEFKVEQAPDPSSSRDKLYAYSLYLDLLLFILKMSGYRVHSTGQEALVAGVGDNKYLQANKMVRSLASNDEIRRAILKERSSIDDFNFALPSVYSSILESSPYKSYIRLKKRELKQDVDFWIDIINMVIAKSPEFLAAARKNPQFTNVGFQNGLNMVVATLDNFSDTRNMLTEAQNSLTRSLDKAHELYYSLLLLCVELTNMQYQRLDAAKHKFLPTPEDLHPDTRFVDNALPRMLADCADMEEYIKSNPISWNDDYTLLRNLLDAILSSEVYAEYMAKPKVTFEDDCEFWRTVYKTIILPSDALAEVLESKSVFWNDDLDIMGTFVLKTIKRIASSGPDAEVKLLPQYKDEEDANFGKELFMYAVDNRDEYRSYIDRFIDVRQWDPERLAFMDIVVMITAIAELLHFPSIPIPVTLNEYIEIANCYSTSRSGQFVNGILYSVINYLKNEGKLLKN